MVLQNYGLKTGLEFYHS